MKHVKAAAEQADAVNTAADRTRKERDTGIDILKIYLAFQVVLVHGWKHYSFPYEPGLPFPWSFFSRSGTVAVPAFILLAFIFTDVVELGRNGSYFRKRMLRLIIPHAAWTFIYFAVYKISDVLCDTDFSLSARDVLIQLFVGHSYHAVMWFQVALIFLTLIFAALSKLSGGGWKQDVLFICVFWICMMGQYAGAFSKIFGKLIPEASIMFGRMCEIAPIAVIGIFFHKYHVRMILKKHWQAALTGSLLGLIVIYSYPVFTNIDGYAYSGFWRLTAALLMVMAACSLPLDGFGRRFKFCNILAKATPGVYYTHKMLLTLLIDGRTRFIYCLLIFAAAIGISAIACQTNHKCLRCIFT